MNPIVVQFIVRGMPDVQRAMRSVQQAASDAARQQNPRSVRTRVEGATGQPSVRTTSSPQPVRFTRTRVEEVQEVRTIGANPSTSRARSRIADPNASVGQDAAKKMAVEDRAAKDKIRAYKMADKIAEQAFDRSIRDQERAEAAKTKTTAREIAKREALQERVDRRKADRDERDGKRREALDGRRKEVRDERFGRGIAANVMTTGGRIVNSITGGMKRTAGLVGQLGGGFSLGDAITGESHLRKQAAELSASSDMSAGKKFSTDEILATGKSVGLAHNIDPASMLKAIDETKKLSGNMETALDVAPIVAKIATATGANVEQVGQLAGNIIAANDKITPQQLSSQLAIFTKQGIEGGVELPDFAKYGARITAGAGLFGTDEKKGVTRESNEAVLGALAQISRQRGGAASAAEATMAAQRFATDVQKKATTLKEDLGIDVSDKKGTLKGAEEIILEMLEKTKGDVTKIPDIGLGERGVRVLTGVADIYRENGGGKTGKEAVQREFKKFTGGVTNDEIEAATKKILAEQQAEIEMKKLTSEIGRGLLPVIRDLVPVFRDAAPVFIEMLKNAIPAFAELIRNLLDFANANKGVIQSLVEHPIGALIGLEITKSFAAAALPALLSKLFSGAFSSAAPSALSAAAPGAGGMAPAAANPVALIAAGGALQAYSMYDTATSITDAHERGANRKAILAEKLRSADPAERQAAQDEVMLAQERNKMFSVQEGGKANAYVEAATHATDIVAGPFAIAGRYAGDKISKSLGYKTGAERRDEAVEAGAKLDGLLVDKDAVRKATTDAIVGGLQDAKRSMANEAIVSPAPTLDSMTRPMAATTGIAQRTP